LSFVIVFAEWGALQQPMSWRLCCCLLAAKASKTFAAHPTSTVFAVALVQRGRLQVPSFGAGMMAVRFFMMMVDAPVLQR
jgi:hypothetical protein